MSNKNNKCDKCSGELPSMLTVKHSCFIEGIHVIKKNNPMIIEEQKMYPNTETWCPKCLITYDPLILTSKVVYDKKVPFVHIKNIFRFSEICCDKCKKQYE